MCLYKGQQIQLRYTRDTKMSRITTVFLHYALLENDSIEHSINAWLAGQHHEPMVKVHHGPTLLIGEWKHFDVVAFLEFFQTVQWAYPHEVRLTLDEDEGCLSEYSPYVLDVKAIDHLLDRVRESASLSAWDWEEYGSKGEVSGPPTTRQKR